VDEAITSDPDSIVVGNAATKSPAADTDGEPSAADTDNESSAADTDIGDGTGSDGPERLEPGVRPPHE
jgi:hypothetical protein